MTQETSARPAGRAAPERTAWHRACSSVLAQPAAHPLRPVSPPPPPRLRRLRRSGGRAGAGAGAGRGQMRTRGSHSAVLSPSINANRSGRRGLMKSFRRPKVADTQSSERHRWLPVDADTDVVTYTRLSRGRTRRTAHTADRGDTADTTDKRSAHAVLQKGTLQAVWTRQKLSLCPDIRRIAK